MAGITSATLLVDIAERRAPWYRRVLHAVRQAHRLQRQRRELLNLDGRIPADIGVTRCDAEREGTKWFWQPPGVIGHPMRNVDDMRFRP